MVRTDVSTCTEIIMKSQEKPAIHELTADELDLASGGMGATEAVHEVVQRAAGLAIVVWDLATNWKDPWA